MADGGLPTEVRELIDRHIASMSHAEALLLLRAEPDRAWTPADAAGETGGTPDALAAVLGDLAAAGIVAQEGTGGAEAFRYAPARPALAAAADAFADAYNRLPVQLVRAIYDRPPPAVQMLADAFRLRKDR